MSSLKNGLSNIFDVITKICAVLLLITYVLLAIDANWEFLGNGTFESIFNFIKHYGPVVIVALVGIEFAVKRNLIIQIVIYALIALMIILQFFPGTWESFIGKF
ncbi:MAG: hypothetical protein IJW25_02960 [Clostridia bacterium]|nr:hypothetical protein [Clostridia bacterium]